MTKRNRLNSILQQQQTGILLETTLLDVQSDVRKTEFDVSDFYDLKQQEMVKRGDIFSEAALEAAEIENSFEESAKQMRYEKFIKVVNCFLIIASIYVVFLIYGVICTQYQYTDEGNIEPTIMSVDELRIKKEYEILLLSYLTDRTIYEEILILDYRLGQGLEDPVIIANEYTALLEAVNTASTKTAATVVDAKYLQMQESLSYWIKNDAALYLQYMSDAITNNNVDSASYAVMWRSKMYEDFLQITSNIVVTGDAIKGVDMTDIKAWTPDGYVDSFINGT